MGCNSFGSTLDLSECGQFPLPPKLLPSPLDSWVPARLGARVMPRKCLVLVPPSFLPPPVSLFLATVSAQLLRGARAGKEAVGSRSSHQVLAKRQQGREGGTPASQSLSVRPPLVIFLTNIFTHNKYLHTQAREESAEVTQCWQVSLKAAPAGGSCEKELHDGQAGKERGTSGSQDSQGNIGISRRFNSS